MRRKNHYGKGYFHLYFNKRIKKQDTYMEIKQVFGMLAILGIIATVCGLSDTATSLITALCIILYLFWPSPPSQEDESFS